MGAFNEISADVACPFCKKVGHFDIQFKYGHTYQMKYKIGDKVEWGGNDYGFPNLKKVLVGGIGGPCPNCGERYIDFDIIFERDVIKQIEGIEKERIWENKDGYFEILEE